MNNELNEPTSNIQKIIVSILIIIIILTIGVISFQKEEISYLEEKIKLQNGHIRNLLNYIRGLELSFEEFKEIEKDIINESVYNFGVMQDLFTPMYNDSVTVENAGYIETVWDWDNNSKISEGGWCFWVNHSRILDSYWFENKISYKVVIPIFGKIFLMEE